MMECDRRTREALEAVQRLVAAGEEHGAAMVQLIEGPHPKPAPTPHPSDGMTVDGILVKPNKPGPLDRLGGWGRLGASLGIAVAIPGVPTLVYLLCYYVGMVLLTEEERGHSGRFIGAPFLGAIAIAVGGACAYAVAMSLIEAGRWIGAGFEADAKRRALREPGTPGVGQVSIAEAAGGELSKPE